MGLPLRSDHLAKIFAVPATLIDLSMRVQARLWSHQLVPLSSAPVIFL